ncbi:hypothetical protein [Moraxella lacunata]|uniref:hypothetical protein n=1 Tax=Moraxella lacunata TaxID=477 RepID=UPI003EE3058F
MSFYSFSFKLVIFSLSYHYVLLLTMRSARYACHTKRRHSPTFGMYIVCLYSL